MKEKPLVTIIIPTYNRGSTINSAIATAAEQTYENIEIVVVDDGSDEPIDPNSIKKEYKPLVSLYVHSENMGASAARNTGLKAASGEYIAFLDDDDRWDQEKIERQVKTFKQCEQSVGLVYTGQRFVQNGEVTAEKARETSGNVLRQMLLGNFVGSFSVVMIRYMIVEEVGLLDERFPNEQDWEWYIRIAKEWEFKPIPEPLVTRHSTPGQISEDYESKRKTSYPLIIKKYRPIAKKFGKIFVRKWGAMIYFKMGWEALVREKDRSLATDYLVKSISYYPFCWQSYIFLLATWMYPVVNRIPKSVKQRIGKKVRW